MFRFFYDWLILPPANLIADILALVLGGLVPFASGLGAGFGMFYLLQPHKQSHPRQWWGLAIGCAALGIYVLVVMATVNERLPPAIFKLGRED